MKAILNRRIVKADKLIPNPKNPRFDLKPGMPLYEKLKDSILHHDYVDPIVWNERTGYIVSGHQRFQVMKDIAEENNDPLTEVEVIVVDLPENRADTLMVAINKITGLWDEEKLSALFKEMSEEDLSYTGFDNADIQKLINESYDMNLIDDEGDYSNSEPKEQTRFIVQIICSSPEEQCDTFEKLDAEGYNCRML